MMMGKKENHDLTSTTRGTGALGLGNGHRDNGLGQMEVLTKVKKTLIGKEIVVVLPAELFSDKTTGLQRLKGLHNLKVRNGDFSMLRGTNILLNNQDTL